MRILILLILIPMLALSLTTRYVAPAGRGGSDSNNGSIGSPYLTIGKAVSMMHDGDTTYLRGGTYAYTGAAKSPWLDSVGTANARFCLWAYPGETPVLDYYNQNNFGDVQTGGNGLHIRGDYWHLKGISVTRAGWVPAVIVQGSHNIIENCRSYNNSTWSTGATWGTGFYIYGRPATREGTRDNLILNCDAWHNYDSSGSAHGNDADGFAADFHLGPGNKFLGCRAWDNSDDGFDFYYAEDSTIIVDSCISFKNGYASGNGIGFKLGGAGSPVSTSRVLVRGCLAAYNHEHGFYDNQGTAGYWLINNTAYKNGNSGQCGFWLNTDGGIPDTLINNISYANSSSSNLIDAPNRQTTDSWSGFTVTNADFASVDSTGFISAVRNADGSLPSSNFLRLVAGSDLVNAGTDVGIPYTGSKPDIGAYGYAAATTSTVTVSTTSLSDFGSIAVNASSASASYTVSGANLTANITITAPTHFAVSRDNNTFGPSVTLTQSSGTVNTTTVYVRFSPTAAGGIAGSIANATAGVTTKNVSVSGTGVQGQTTSSLSVSVSSLPDFGSVMVGSSSSVKSFAVSGSNLTSNVTVTAPSQFQVSLSSTSGFSTSVSVAPSGGTVSSQTVYARFSPTSTGAMSSSVNVASSGAATRGVNVSGTGTLSPTPSVTVSVTSLPDFGNCKVWQKTYMKSYTVSGSYLTGNITVTAPYHFLVSLSKDNGYGRSVTIAPTSGTVSSRTIWVVFAPTSTGFKAGTIRHASSGATTRRVYVSGTGTLSSAGSSTTSITTGEPLPELSLMLPASGSFASGAVSLQWAWLAGAEAFQVQVARDSLFAAMVIDTVVADTVWRAPVRFEEGRYFSRGRALGSGVEGAYSPAVAFSVGTSTSNDAPVRVMEFRLVQNYPNPFNPTTTLRFDLPQPGQVSLKVYNSLGSEVAEIMSGYLSAGSYTRVWDATGLATGTYFCRLQVGDKTATTKMLLVK